MGRLRRHGHESFFKRARRRERGFIFLDALVALIIVLIGFSALLSGISVAERLAVKQRERVTSLIERRNAHATGQTVLFQGR
jgi:type II secretory pathway pseudopilin PulG